MSLNVSVHDGSKIERVETGKKRHHVTWWGDAFELHTYTECSSYVGVDGVSPVGSGKRRSLNVNQKPSRRDFFGGKGSLAYNDLEQILRDS